MTKAEEKIPSQVILKNLLKYYQSGRFGEAEKLAMKITKQFPKHQFSWKVLGSILRSEGRISDSLTFSQKAVDLNSKDADAHNNLGNVLNDLSRLDEAEESYRRAIALKPNYADAYNNLGNTLNNLYRPDEARVSYIKAIELNPDFIQAHYNLGLLFYEAAEYKKAARYFKNTSFKKSKYYLLKCLYYQDKPSLFYDQLDHFIEKAEVEPIIGSLICRSELRYGVKKNNLFCKEPLKYVLKSNLNNQYDFEKIFTKVIKAILNENKITAKRQQLLSNGYQTSGNLFDIEKNLTDNIRKIIYSEIEKYRTHFKDSKEGFITNWPKSYNLYGWLVNMKNGGKLDPHMHDRGWLSGSIYINVPPKIKQDSGNLVVCVEDERLIKKDNNEKISVNVITGSICLFPASLLHYTIPFESDQERIVLAFDVIPN